MQFKRRNELYGCVIKRTSKECQIRANFGLWIGANVKSMQNTVQTQKSEALASLRHPKQPRFARAAKANVHDAGNFPFCARKMRLSIEKEGFLGHFARNQTERIIDENRDLGFLPPPIAEPRLERLTIEKNMHKTDRQRIYDSKD